MSSTNVCGVNLNSIVWLTLEKVAAKEGQRNDLSQGDRHELDLRMIGTVDGINFQRSVSAIVDVGHDSVRATSATPDQAQLLAVILAKLNATTREKLLRELPEQFAANGHRLPDVDSDLVDAAAAMLKRLRSKKSVLVRGAVRCQYRLDDLGGGTPSHPDQAAVLPMAAKPNLRVAG